MNDASESTPGNGNESSGVGNSMTSGEPAVAGAKKFTRRQRADDGAVNLARLRAGCTEVTTNGYAYDDEPGEVELQLRIGGSTVIVGFDVDGALELADNLATTARDVKEADL